MKQPFRVTLGLWLERFKFLHLILLEYSHDYPEGKSWYMNRVSRTMMRKS